LKYSLSGTVINSVTGAPIDHALVKASWGPSRLRFSQSDGSFQLDGLPGRPMRLTAEKPGFFPASNGGGTGALDAEIVQADGQTVAPVLKLEPEAIIEGSVLGDENQPLENVAITIGSFQVINGHRQWSNIAATNTDDQGEFRIPGLHRGAYYVAAHPEKNIDFPSSTSTERVYLPTYYPHGAGISTATPIQLAAGQHARADFSLHSLPAFRVSGIVAGAQQGLKIKLRFVDASGSASGPEVEVGAKGAFEARVPGGNWIVRAVAGDAKGHPRAYAERAFKITDNRAGIYLDLVPLSPIPVVVHLAPAESIPSNPETDFGRLPGSGVMVHVLSDDPSRPDGFAEGKDPANMSLTVLPGRYRVELAAKNRSWYVQSASRGSADLLQQPLVTGASGGQPIVITLSNDFATLHGSVAVAGDHGAVVVLVSQRSPTDSKTMFLRTSSDFEFHGLAPGDYQVLAFDRIDGLEYANPTVLGAYAGKAAKVGLQPNATATVSVQTIHRGEINE